MGKETSNAMKYVAGIPTVIELLAKRNVDPQKAPVGVLNTEIEADITSNDSKLLVSAKVQVKISGVPKGSSESAFTVECKMECIYTFSTERSNEDLENKEFVLKLCDPIYQRASVIAQDSCWKLGFGRVRLPITMPKDIKAIAETAKKASAKKAPAKKATAKKVSAKKSATK